MTTDVATLPAQHSPWAAWGEKMAFARELVGTGFCPAAIKTPAQALAIILTGQELGVPPMHSLRSINIIEGKPSLSAELMLALMLRGGVVLEWLESTAERATLRATRAKTAFTGTFTLEDAKAANLLGKIGWRSYPAAMLRARVISLVARVVAPDLIAGLYTPEELGADVDAEGTILSAPAPASSEDAPSSEAPADPLADDGEAPEPWNAVLSDFVTRFDEATTLEVVAGHTKTWLKAREPVPKDEWHWVQEAITRAQKRLG